MTLASDLFEPTHTKEFEPDAHGEATPRALMRMMRIPGPTLYHLKSHLQPGDSKSVTLVRIGGKQVIRGGNGIADAPVDDANITSLMEAVHTRGFKHSEETNASEGVITEGSSTEVCGRGYGACDSNSVSSTEVYALNSTTFVA